MLWNDLSTLAIFCNFSSEIKLNTGKRLESEGVVFYVCANRVFGNDVNVTDFPLMSALKSAQTYFEFLQIWKVLAPRPQFQQSQ